MFRLLGKDKATPERKERKEILLKSSWFKKNGIWEKGVENRTKLHKKRKKVNVQKNEKRKGPEGGHTKKIQRMKEKRVWKTPPKKKKIFFESHKPTQKRKSGKREEKVFLGVVFSLFSFFKCEKNFCSKNRICIFAFWMKETFSPKKRVV